MRRLAIGGCGGPQRAASIHARAALDSGTFAGQLLRSYSSRRSGGSSSHTRAWLRKVKQDHHGNRVKRAGFRSRAAAKLLEIDERFSLLRPGQAVLELGCAPGSWTQVAVAKVNSTGFLSSQPRGSVVAVDISKVRPVEGAIVAQLDPTTAAGLAELRQRLPPSWAAGGGRARCELVLSDMAPATSGNRQHDHEGSLELVMVALRLAEKMLSPGGAVVTKLFQGGAEAQLLRWCRRRFEVARFAKPKASRTESREVFLVATGRLAEPAEPSAAKPSAAAKDVFQRAVRRLQQAGVPEPADSAAWLLSAALADDPAAAGTAVDLRRFEPLACGGGAPLPQEARRRYRAMLERRLRREPVQYIVGGWAFRELTLALRPPCLIPRPETEELVGLVLAAATAAAPLPPHTFLDVGCGSGAIVVSLLKAWPTARAFAVDITSEAVALTRENAAAHGVADRLTVLQACVSGAELLAAAPAGGFDLLVSNPPYIATAEWQALEPEVLQWESPLALDGGGDGLAIVRMLLDAALGVEGQGEALLKPGAALWLELGLGQPERLAQLLSPTKHKVEVHADYSGRGRFLCLCRSARSEQPDQSGPFGAGAIQPELEVQPAPSTEGRSRHTDTHTHIR